MPLSEDNQVWVRDEINKALNPNGFKKAANFLRYWGMLAVSVTAFLALIAMVITLAIFALNQVGQESEFRGKSDARLTNVEGRLKDIEATLLGLRAAQSSESPTDSKNIAEAEAVLGKARESAIRLPIDIIKQSGAAFVTASSKEPAAWNAVLAFLNYRSLLNADSSPNAANFKNGAKINWQWDLSALFQPERIPEQDLLRLDWGPRGVPHDEAAALERLGHPLNANEQIGPQFLLLESASPLHLDGYKIKNVIFRNDKITYGGGPLEMDGVYFVNCTFDFQFTPTTQKLSYAILDSSPTTFRHSG